MTDDDRRQFAEGGLVTVKEAAELLRLGRTSVYGLITSRRLPTVRFGRAVRIPRTAIAKLIADSLDHLAEG
jgi:excisionase family DNA binding protein